MIDAKINNRVTPTLDDWARQFPSQMQKALRDLGQWLRKRIAEEMRAGQAAGQPLASLDPLTVRLKEANAILDTRKRIIGKKSKRRRNLTPQIQRLSRAFGGKLPDILEYMISDGTVNVGFLGSTFPGTPAAAARYQSADSRPFTPREHRMIRLLLGSHFRQPTQLNRPARPVIVDWAESDELRQQVNIVIEKSIKAQIANSLAKAAR